MSAIRFGREQAMLLDIAARFFRERWPIASVREQLSTESGFDAGLWAEMAELGWLAIALPEEHGGTGLGVSELVVLAEPMGRALHASPFVPTQLAIQALLAGGSEAQRAKWLRRLGEGAVGAVAACEEDGGWDLLAPRSLARRAGTGVALEGTKTFVLDAGVADLVLVTVLLEGRPAIALVEQDQLSARQIEREIVIDETRRSYRLTLDGIEVGSDAMIAGAAAARALAAVRDTALLLVSAEACGGTAAALDLIVEYLRSRRQFGSLIGSFQALKHPTVDVLIGLERSRSHLYHAATVFGEPQAEVALRMAKAAAGDAFAFAGDRAIQFHGAFGFTYECDAQLFLRRAIWCQTQYGDALHHRKHLADLLL
jgi:alkylation response protein AidB-like acyl-CoA dehydrogenase